MQTGFFGGFPWLVSTIMFFSIIMYFFSNPFSVRISPEMYIIGNLENKRYITSISASIFGPLPGSLLHRFIAMLAVSIRYLRGKGIVKGAHSQPAQDKKARFPRATIKLVLPPLFNSVLFGSKRERTLLAGSSLEKAQQMMYRMWQVRNDRYKLIPLVTELIEMAGVPFTEAGTTDL